MKIALAGGTSLLARDLISQLERTGHDVIAFSRKPTSDCQLEYSELSSSRFNLIINMAGGYHGSAEENYVNSIVSLGKFLAREADRQSAHLIHLSSGTCLEPSDVFTSLTPLASPPFSSGYQEAKVKLENLHRTLRASQPIADLRILSFADKFFLTDSSYVLGAIWKSKRSGRQFVFSGDEFVRDYIGGVELASAINSAAEDMFSGVFNLHSSKPIHSAELVKFLIDDWGCDVSYGKDSRKKCKPYLAKPEAVLKNYNPRPSLEVISEAFRSCSYEL